MYKKDKDQLLKAGQRHQNLSARLQINIYEEKKIYTYYLLIIKIKFILLSIKLYLFYIRLY